MHLNHRMLRREKSTTAVFHLDRLVSTVIIAIHYFDNIVPSALRGAVETVRQLFDSYLKLVQDDSSGDILYAVRGITCLAPAALLCLGDSVSLLDILNTLINSAEHYLASTVRNAYIMM